MAKNPQTSSLDVVSSQLTAIGKKLSIDPEAKFNAQYLLSRENADLKGASMATKIVLKELRGNPKHGQYLEVSLLNEAAIFSHIFDGKKLSGKFDDSDEYNNTLKVQGNIEKLLSEYKYLFLPQDIDAQKIILNFYKVSADLFGVEVTMYQEQIFSFLELFSPLPKLQSLAEGIVFKNYAKSAQCLMNTLIVDIWYDSLNSQYVNEDDTPAYKFHVFVSVFTSYFLANEKCVDKDVHADGLRLVRYMDEVYDLAKDKKLQYIVAEEDNLSFIHSLYKNKEFSDSLAKLLVFPKRGQSFDRVSSVDKLLALLRELKRKF